MSMTGGTVTIADDGTVAGAGLARALFDAQMTLIPAFRDAGAQRETQRGIATWANAIAAAIVGYVQANAVARVVTEVLGRTPNPNNPNTNIQPPAAPVDVPIQ